MRRKKSLLSPKCTPSGCAQGDSRAIFSEFRKIQRKLPARSPCRKKPVRAFSTVCVRLIGGRRFAFSSFVLTKEEKATKRRNHRVTASAPANLPPFQQGGGARHGGGNALTPPQFERPAPSGASAARKARTTARHEAAGATPGPGAETPARGGAPADAGPHTNPNTAENGPAARGGTARATAFCPPTSVVCSV